jgi:outer membrane protein insertion porin family
MSCRKMLEKLIVVLLLTVLLPLWVRASVISSVQVRQTGVGRVDQEYVLAHTQTRSGDVFQANVAARDVRRLLDTGRFTTVDVSVSAVVPGTDTLDVIFTVQPRMRLGRRPYVDGVQAFSQRRVRNWLDLQEGALVDDQVAGDGLRRVLDEYRKRHYQTATGSWDFVVVDEGRGIVELRYALDEGHRSAVRRIQVEGNESFPVASMRQALRRPHPLNPWRWVVAKSYEPGELDEVVSNVRRFYLDRGYLDVQVDVRTGDRRRGQYAAIVVAEGPLYRVGQVEIKGVTLFDPVLIESLVGGMTRSEAGLEALDAGADRIQGFYGDRGYLETVVRPLLVPDLSSRTVDVTFQVSEGGLVHLRNILIRGNSRTKDKVIRREVLVQPGEVYNRSRVQRSENRLRNLGYFRDRVCKGLTHGGRWYA